MVIVYRDRCFLRVSGRAYFSITAIAYSEFRNDNDDDDDDDDDDDYDTDNALYILTFYFT